MDLWDHARSEPVSTFQWGSDTVVSVRFNPAEPDLLASTASDRSLALYDLRSSTPVRKLIMQVTIQHNAARTLDIPLNHMCLSGCSRGCCINFSPLRDKL